MSLSLKKALSSFAFLLGIKLLVLNFASAETADSYIIPTDSQSVRSRAEYSIYRTGEYPIGGATSEEITIAKRRFPMNTVEGRTELIQLYPRFNTRAGFCGSYVYSGPENVVEESFAHPVTACVITRLAEEWRKNFCPSNRPCRLEMGDIAHHTEPDFDGHSTHDDGYCIDLRPIKTEGEGERALSNPDYTGALTHEDPNYDQAKTRQLLGLITRLGGDTLKSSDEQPDTLIFNDPDLIEEGIARRAEDHDNHIHVCFRPENPLVQKSCAEYTPDEKLCPTAGVLFNHPVMSDKVKELNETLSQ